MNENGENAIDKKDIGVAVECVNTASGELSSTSQTTRDMVKDHSSVILESGNYMSAVTGISTSTVDESDGDVGNSDNKPSSLSHVVDDECDVNSTTFASFSKEEIVSEKSKKYEILISKNVDDVLADMEKMEKSSRKLSQITDPTRMLTGCYASHELIHALWKEKTRMDRVFDNGKQKHYYDARHRIFPQDRHGSARYRNRAGDKLFEVHVETGLFSLPQAPRDSTSFFDICGGPGAWSEVLLKECHNMRGFGMTLKESTAKNVDWYGWLERNDRWTSVWGSDGSGNVYSMDNVAHVRASLADKHVMLAAADGGLNVSTNEKGEHVQNYQELYSARLILSEWVLMSTTLNAGGNWCCKMFDTFSHVSASIVYATAVLFEKTYIVKPRRSRLVNSERYLVGINRLAKSSNSDRFVGHMTNVHATWNDDESPDAPISADIMMQDAPFVESFSACVQLQCCKQVYALNLVMTEVEKSL